MAEPSSRDFRVPPVLYTGYGAIERLREVMKALAVTRGVVVTDRVMGASSWMDRLRQLAQDAGAAITVLDELASEPTVDDVNAALKCARDMDADVLIGFGGGSALDTAKCAAALVTNGGDIIDYEGYERFPRRGLPIVAIPTTAGTGSEVTRGAAITDSNRNVKMLLMSAWLVPTVAIVDPEPTLTMPAAVTASTGLDALTHAIESFVSRRRQPISDALALDAMARIARHLPHVFESPDDRLGREQMCLGSLMAGMAFHNASVALVHGMSRPIGAYFHVPHGLSNAMLLPTVMAFSVPGDPVRYATVARAIGAASAADPDEAAAWKGVEAVRLLCQQLEVPSPTAWGINPVVFRDAAPQMARDAIASGSPGNNPRLATEEEITALYGQMIAG